MTAHAKVSYETAREIVRLHEQQHMPYAMIGRRLGLRDHVVCRVYNHCKNGHGPRKQPCRGYVLISYGDEHRELYSLKHFDTRAAAAMALEQAEKQVKSERVLETVIESETLTCWRVIGWNEFRREWVDFYRQLGLVMTVAGRPID